MAVPVDPEDCSTSLSIAFGYVLPDMKLMRSSLVTLPPLPVPGTALMSTPFFLAMCLTAGVERALDEAKTALFANERFYLPGPDCAFEDEDTL